MTRISDEQLDKFIILYKQEFGVELSRSEAYSKASLVLEYFKICLGVKEDKKREEVILS